MDEKLYKRILYKSEEFLDVWYVINLHVYLKSTIKIYMCNPNSVQFFFHIVLAVTLQCKVLLFSASIFYMKKIYSMANVVFLVIVFSGAFCKFKIRSLLMRMFSFFVRYSENHMIIKLFFSKKSFPCQK